MIDKTLWNTMLLDFFGDMLTEKQREYYDLYHNSDLSLSEIGDRVGISKQGVLDIIKRAEKKLMIIEQRTGIIQKWCETRAGLEQVIKEGVVVHPIALRYFQLEENDNGV